MQRGDSCDAQARRSLRKLAGRGPEPADSRLLIEISLLSGWHYVEGSRFDTRFWREAQVRFERGLNETLPERTRSRFVEQLAQRLALCAA
jgi:hypothetical protein